ATVLGSVVSSTKSRSLWVAERSTSGPSDEPPMPHSTIFDASMLAAHAARSAASSCMRRGTSNHPSRSGASLPLRQSGMSRRRSRPARAPASSRSVSAIDRSAAAFGRQRVGLVAERLHQLVEALGERRHTLFLERAGDILDVDAERGQVLEVPAGLVDSLVDG